MFIWRNKYRLFHLLKGLHIRVLSPETGPLASLQKTRTLFVAFSWAVACIWPGGFNGLCVYFMTGAHEGSTHEWFWRSRGSNLRPLLYKAKHVSTTPRQLPNIKFKISKILKFRNSSKKACRMLKNLINFKFKWSTGFD